MSKSPGKGRTPPQPKSRPTNAKAPDAPLTPKQKLFVEAFIKCRNGTEAAKAAGYAPGSAHSTASDLLKHPKVKAYIEQFMKDSAMSASEVIARLSAHAAADVREFIGLTPEQIKASERGWLIKKYKSSSFTTYDKDGVPTVQTTTDIELHDAQTALKTLAQTYSLLNQKIDVTSNGKPLADTRPVIVLNFGDEGDDNGGIGGE